MTDNKYELRDYYATQEELEKHQLEIRNHVRENYKKLYDKTSSHMEKRLIEIAIKNLDHESTPEDKAEIHQINKQLLEDMHYSPIGQAALRKGRAKGIAAGAIDFYLLASHCHDHGESEAEFVESFVGDDLPLQIQVRYLKRTGLWPWPLTN